MSPPVITSEAVRGVSHLAFQSRYRIEVALAIMKLEETFVFDDLWELIEETAKANGVERPAQSKVRAELGRLRDLGAVERMPKVRGTLVQREVRRESAIFALCQELHARAVSM